MADRHLIAGGDQVLENVPAIPINNHGSGRYFDNQVLRTTAGTIRSRSGLPGVSPPMFAMGNASKIVRAGPSANDDGAASPAIAAVRPALRDILLAAKADAAIAAIAALYKDRHSINKHLFGPLSVVRRPLLLQLQGIGRCDYWGSTTNDGQRTTDRR